MFRKHINEIGRQEWLGRVLGELPQGARLLDAGAGECKNRKHCQHLRYVSQDLCEYAGVAGAAPLAGLQLEHWDTRNIDIVSDVTAIPEPSESFDAVLCSEVLEHIPDPPRAITEFARLLRPGGTLILTAPFSSNVHFAPFHFSSGFSRYWYEHHLPANKFVIETLEPHGDWFALLEQELGRLGSLERQKRSWSWPLGYALGALGHAYFRIRTQNEASDLAAFGWNCRALKR
jgi:SAM-dependent methyltransferase